MRRHARRRGTRARRRGRCSPRRTRTLAVSSLIPSAARELGLQPGAGTDECPGALVHRALTVGARSDDILGGVRELFLLDPDVVFLNHGSFGACPRPVFERYQAWQRELEREPVDFIARRLPALLAAARGELGAYVGAPRRRPDLRHERDHRREHRRTLARPAARRRGARDRPRVRRVRPRLGVARRAHRRAYVRAAIPLPLASAATRRRALRARHRADARRLRRHITSATALVLPVEEIVARARELGLVTIVDGAHAPAQVDLDLDALGADFYAGNCHKWLCAPKGAGFLHVRPEHQERVDGPIVSWGYAEPATFISRADRDAGDARPGRVPRRPGRDRVPGASTTGTPSASAAARSPRGARASCAISSAPSRSRPRRCWPDGERPASAARARPPRRLFANHRIEIPSPGRRRPAADLGRGVHDREDVDRLLAALARELDAEHGQQDEQRKPASQNASTSRGCRVSRSCCSATFPQRMRSPTSAAAPTTITGAR